MEGENVAGNRRQEKGEAQAEGNGQAGDTGFSPLLWWVHLAGLGDAPWVLLMVQRSWAGDGAAACVCPQEQRLVEDSTREVKKVRKARNRRLEWNMMAYDKEFRPDNRFSPSPYHMASSEGSLSPDNRQVLPTTC